jgi:hypothetical protein
LWRYCEGCRTCCRTWCLASFQCWNGLKWFEGLHQRTQFILTLLIWIVENDGYDSSVSQEWKDENYSTSAYNQCSISQYIIVFAPGTTGCICFKNLELHIFLHWASTVSMHMLAGLFLPRSHTRSCLNGDHHYLQRTAKLLLKIVSAHFRTEEPYRWNITTREYPLRLQSLSSVESATWQNTGTPKDAQSICT